jgi:hypothetical protein
VDIRTGPNTVLSLVQVDTNLNMSNNNVTGVDSIIANNPLDPVKGIFEAAVTAQRGVSSSWGMYYPLRNIDYYYSDISKTQASGGLGTPLTVGRTGSGCDIVYTLLDSVPTDAKALRMFWVANISHGTGVTANCSIMVWLRETVTNINTVLCDVRCHIANEEECQRGIIEYAIDSTSQFTIIVDRYLVSGATFSVSMGVTGYYI